jgi:hypothetical protein
MEGGGGGEAGRGYVQTMIRARRTSSLRVDT